MTIHTFETLAEAQAALATAATTDYTVHADTPFYFDGDVFEIEEPALVAYVVRGELRALRHEDADSHGLAFVNGDSPMRNAAIDHHRTLVVRHREASIRTKKSAIVARIAAAIGPRASTRPSTSTWSGFSYDALLIDGEPATSLTVHTDQNHDSWRAVPTGKISVIVGDYGNKTRFPQRRDGTHNYAEIARLLLAERARYVAQMTNEARRRENQAALTDELKASLGCLRYSAYPSSDPDCPVQIRLTINRALTVEAARALAAALEAVGVV